MTSFKRHGLSTGLWALTGLAIALVVTIGNRSYAVGGEETRQAGKPRVCCENILGTCGACARVAGCPADTREVPCPCDPS